MTDVVIGIDLGGTKIAAGVIDAAGQLLGHETRPTHRTSGEAVLGEMADLARELRAEAPDVRAIGIGIPGTIDIERGALVEAVNLPLDDVPVVARMRDAVGLPVVIDNDANVAALAEQRHGAARGTRSMLMITLGTGVGGGVIIDGSIFRGSTGGGAELGHMVMEYTGPDCPGACNNQGCVEAYVSGTAVARMARERGLPDLDATTVVSRALAGEADAADLMADVGRCLGIALSSYANIFQPEMIVVGGGLAAAANEILLPIARREVRRRSLRPNNHVAIEAALLGANAGVIGAGELARSEIPVAI
jgi:glucokinase